MKRIFNKTLFYRIRINQAILKLIRRKKNIYSVLSNLMLIQLRTEKIIKIIFFLSKMKLIKFLFGAYFYARHFYILNYIVEIPTHD